MVILEVIGTILGILVLLISAILLFPLRLKLGGEFQEEKKILATELFLINGLIKTKISINFPVLEIFIKLFGRYLLVAKKDLTKKVEIKKVEKIKTEKKAKSKSKKSLKERLELAKDSVKYFQRAIHFEKIEADLSVGFSNPAPTGLVLGAFYFFRGVFSWGPDVKFNPDFYKPALRGFANLSIKVQLYKLVPLIFIIFGKGKK